MKAAVMYLKDLVFSNPADQKFYVHELMRDPNVHDLLQEVKNLIILVDQLPDTTQGSIYYEQGKIKPFKLEDIFNAIREQLSHYAAELVLYTSSDLMAGVYKIDINNKIESISIKPETFTTKTLLTHLVESIDLSPEQLSYHGITHFKILSSDITDYDFNYAINTIRTITQAYAGEKDEAPTQAAPSKKRKQSSDELRRMPVANPYHGSATLFPVAKNGRIGAKNAWVVFDTDDTLLALTPSSFSNSTCINTRLIYRAHQLIQHLQEQEFEIKCSLMSARSTANEEKIRERMHFISMPAVRDAVNALGLFDLSLDQAICHSYPVHKNPNDQTLELENRKVEHIYRLIKSGEIEAPNMVILIDDSEAEWFPSSFDNEDRPCPLIVIPASRYQPVWNKPLETSETLAPEAVGMRL